MFALIHSANSVYSGNLKSSKFSSILKFCSESSSFYSLLKIQVHVPDVILNSTSIRRCALTTVAEKAQNEPAAESIKQFPDIRSAAAETQRAVSTPPFDEHSSV